MTMLSQFSGIRRPAAALFALGLGAFAASPGFAAAQIRQGTWFESLTASCPNTTGCGVQFSPIPAGKTLVARNVSCRMIVPNGAVITLHYISGGGGLVFIPVGTPPVVFPSAHYFYENTEIFATFAPGQTPQVSFVSSSTGTLNAACSLSGDLKP